jgi:hypothetical protein
MDRVGDDRVVGEMKVGVVVARAILIDSDGDGIRTGALLEHKTRPGQRAILHGCQQFRAARQVLVEAGEAALVEREVKAIVFPPVGVEQRQHLAIVRRHRIGDIDGRAGGAIVFDLPAKFAPRPRRQVIEIRVKGGPADVEHGDWHVHVLQVIAGSQRVGQLALMRHDVHETEIQPPLPCRGLHRIDDRRTNPQSIHIRETVGQTHMPSVAERRTAHECRQRAQPQPPRHSGQAAVDHVIQRFDIVGARYDVTHRRGDHAVVFAVNEIERLDAATAAPLDREQPAVRGERVVARETIPVARIDV